LGVRQSDAKFSATDYARYEDVRDRLLRTFRGRAALKRGGIAWRLALECVPFDDVWMGPSGTYTRQDCVVIDEDLFVDDELNAHEIDIICGVYRVPNGGHIDASWWPKENVWNSSGMYVGYWTDVNEQWFRKRAAEIQGGAAQPIASQHWKSKLS
ncbi:hypothetical protein BDW22DRAFT_1296247, partial [Trametopsis cervina]